MSFVEIYTDGSSKGNPGQGGWGAIIFDEEKVLEIGGNEENTTNNRMEMRAAIEALKILPEGAEAKLHTDSEYLMKGITIWILGWQKNNWRNANKKPVLNKELWEKLYELTQEFKPKWTYVKGHNEHEHNDRADLIATSFAEGEPVKLKNAR